VNRAIINASESRPRDLVVLGEALMSLAPEGHESVRRSHSLRRFTAGAEINVAVAAARLGHTVTWLGRIGDDLTGQGVMDDLTREGLRLDHVILDTAHHTGIAIREIPPLGPAQVSYARRHSAGSSVTPGDLDPEVIGQHRMAHVSAVTPALGSSAADAARYFLTEARARQVTTVFDLNYRSRLWSAESAAPVMRELAALADIVSGGANEWELAFGTSDLQSIPLPPETSLVQTAGHNPVLARVDGAMMSSATIPARAEDVVGAGDAFVGGVLSALLAGADWSVALRQGAYCGARVVSGVGDWSNLPWGVAGLVDIPESDQEVMR